MQHIQLDHSKRNIFFSWKKKKSHYSFFIHYSGLYKGMSQMFREARYSTEYFTLIQGYHFHNVAPKLEEMIGFPYRWTFMKMVTICSQERSNLPCNESWRAVGQNSYWHFCYHIMTEDRPLIQNVPSEMDCWSSVVAYDDVIYMHGSASRMWPLAAVYHSAPLYEKSWTAFFVRGTWRACIFIFHL